MRKLIIIFLVTGLAFAMHVSFRTKVPETREELGQLLFFDPILSVDKTISCASCHRPEYAFADTAAVSRGVFGRTGTRNAPTAMNVRLHATFFWDGRVTSLEEQALAPIENPDEMGLPVDKAVERLKSDKSYSIYFEKIFGTQPSRELLGAAIAAFERSLETSDSPFDRWKFSGDSNAVSKEVKSGFALFNGKGKCVKCHFGADLTANEFRNIGLFDGKQFNDSGRSIISGKKEDLGKFKTPTLRNVALTAPYMHDGSLKTLDDVIEFYDHTEKRVPEPVNKDTILARPLDLTVQEKAELKAFLISLTDQRFVMSR
jgi:cytochrome c peroxidase